MHQRIYRLLFPSPAEVKLELYRLVSPQEVLQTELALPLLNYFPSEKLFAPYFKFFDVGGYTNLWLGHNLHLVILRESFDFAQDKLRNRRISQLVL